MAGGLLGLSQVLTEDIQVAIELPGVGFTGTAHFFDNRVLHGSSLNNSSYPITQVLMYTLCLIVIRSCLWGLTEIDYKSV